MHISALKVHMASRARVCRLSVFFAVPAEDLNRVRRELDAKADKMRRLSALLSKFEAKLGALGSEASELVAAREEARDVAPDMVVNMARKLAYTCVGPPPEQCRVRG